MFEFKKLIFNIGILINFIKIRPFIFISFLFYKNQKYDNI